MLSLNAFLLLISLIVHQKNAKECTLDSQISKYVESERLPSYIIPKHYDISFVFDEEMSSYQARASIEITVNEETDVIILHADKFTIESVDGFKHTRGHPERVVMKFTDICFVKKAQFLVLRLEKSLTEKEVGHLLFEFNGKNSQEYIGLSYYKYQTIDKMWKNMVSSKFQDTMARTVFPCFDEPHFKAVFHLEIVNFLPYMSVSSSGVERKIIKDRIVAQKFLPTKLISTYSLGFAVFDFEYVSGVTKSGVYVGVYLPKDYIQFGSYALDLTLKIIDTYEYLLGVEYPSDKLDIVALVENEATAISSLGLIKFDYEYLFVDEKKACYCLQIEASLRIAYEIAYQWFGHLVTPHWWSDIWLSDGISEFVSHYAIHLIRPQYKTMDELKMRKTTSLMFDEMKPTHTLSYKMKPKNRTFFSHDSITNNKGAEILEILYAHTGEKKFFKCLEKYIKEFQYSTADSLKFWSVVEIETGSGHLYHTLMQFTYSAGFPLISLEKGTDEDSYKISQQRMLLTDDIIEIKKAADQIWHLPIYYKTSLRDTQIKQIWLTEKTDTIKLENGEKFIMMNPDNFYFYRSKYDNETLRYIAESLVNDIKSFSVAEKISFISDAFAMLEYGKYDVKTTFDQFEFMKQETDWYVVWTYYQYILIVAFYTCDPIHPNTKFYEYALELSKSILNHTGRQHVDNGLLRQTQINSLAISMLTGDDEIIEKSSDMFEEYLKGIPVDDFDLMIVYACGYIVKKNIEAVEKIFDLYKETNDPTLTEIYLNSFLCIKDKDSAKKLLDLTLTEEVIKHDKMKIVMIVNQYYPGSELAKEFIMTKYNELVSLFPEDPYHVRSYFYDIFSRYKTMDDLDLFKSFLDEHKISQDDDDIQYIVEAIKKAITWRKLNLDDFNKYFS